MSLKADDNKVFVFMDEAAIKAKKAKEKEKEEAVQAKLDAGGVRHNPYLTPGKIWKLTKRPTDDPETLRRLLENDEKARIRKRKTNKHVGSFWGAVIGALTFSPSKFKAGCKTIEQFFWLGRFSEDPDYKGPDEDECALLYKDKTDTFLESITSGEFLKPAARQLALFIILPGIIARLTFPLSGLKHPFWSILAIAALMVCWVSIKIFINMVLDVYSSTYKTVVDRKAQEDKVLAEALAKQKKAEENQKKADKARKKANGVEEKEDKTLGLARPSGRGRYSGNGS